ncbi:hypothetical protein GCM10027294_19840 [Marinactinospora endophytica]
MRAIFSTSLPGTPESVYLARRFVVGALAVPEEVPLGIVEDAKVIVSELATNAIRHTRSGDPGGTYDLYFSIDIDVRGLSGSIRTKPPKVRSVLADDDSPCVGGRGLHLVRSLAAECGSLEPYEHGTFFALRWGGGA